jgi:hypothetical protein
MHPHISQAIAAQRVADAIREAGASRRVRDSRRGRPARNRPASVGLGPEGKLTARSAGCR